MLYPANLLSHVGSGYAPDAEYFSATTILYTLAAGDPYITFTCHFIDHHWEMKSYCLQTHYLLQDHIATNIKEVLTETLELWNWRQPN